MPSGRVELISRHSDLRDLRWSPTAMIVAIALSFATLAGCETAESPATAAASPVPAGPPVGWRKPEIKKLEEWMTFTGSTRAEKTIELRSRVRGYLTDHYFDEQDQRVEVKLVEGSLVKKDQVLFVIDRDPFLAEHDAALANLQQAKATLEQSKAMLLQSQSTLDLAQKNYDRVEQLRQQNAISDQQLEIAVSELENRKANMASSTAAINAAAASVASAEAMLKQAELNLTYTLIRSPIDGRIGEQMLDTGNLILPDQTLLAVVESVAPIHAYFTVSERDLLKAKQLLPHIDAREMSALKVHPQMSLGDQNNYEFIGDLDFTELGVDPSTGTTFRRALFENKDQRLIPGMFVRIRVSMGEAEDRLLVDQESIGTDQNGDFLLIIGDKNIIERRSVVLGPTDGNKRVIRSGIQAGELVVCEGLQRARPGSPVTPVDADAKNAAAAATAAKGDAAPEPAGESKAIVASEAKSDAVPAKQSEEAPANVSATNRERQ